VGFDHILSPIKLLSSVVSLRNNECLQPPERLF